MKILIIDDNLSDLNHLDKLLRGFDQVEEVFVARGFRTALESIQYLHIDAVFTDVDLDGENGIELMQNFPSNTPKIIVSAYPHFAIESFSVQPLHFIQKPVKEKDLAIAIQRIQKVTEKCSVKTQSFIFIQHEGQHIKIDLDDIVWVKSAENYVELKTLNSKFLVLANLTQFLKQLPEQKFLRIQKTTALPIAQISSYGNEHVTASNEIFGIGPAYKKKVLEVLGKQTIKRKI